MFFVVNGSCFAASLQMANPRAGRVEQSRNGPRQSPEPDSPEKLDANNAKKMLRCECIKGHDGRYEGRDHQRDRIQKIKKTDRDLRDEGEVTWKSKRVAEELTASASGKLCMKQTNRI